MQDWGWHIYTSRHRTFKKKSSYSSLTFSTIEQVETESKTLTGEKSQGKLNIFISFSLLSRSASHTED